MKHVIFLNRWGVVFHAILCERNGLIDDNIASKVSVSLEEARRVVEQWRQEYAVDPADINDNERIDLNELLDGIETDFSPRNN